MDLPVEPARLDGGWQEVSDPRGEAAVPPLRDPYPGPRTPGPRSPGPRWTRRLLPAGVLGSAVDPVHHGRAQVQRAAAPATPAATSCSGGAKRPHERVARPGPLPTRALFSQRYRFQLDYRLRRLSKRGASPRGKVCARFPLAGVGVPVPRPRVERSPCVGRALRGGTAGSGACVVPPRWTAGRQRALQERQELKGPTRSCTRAGRSGFLSPTLLPPRESPPVARTQPGSRDLLACPPPRGEAPGGLRSCLQSCWRANWRCPWRKCIYQCPSSGIPE